MPLWRTSVVITQQNDYNVGGRKAHPKKEKIMIFKPMTLEEAKEMYEKLKAEPPSTLVKIAMEEIWFFTDGLKKNYREVK